MYQTHRHRFIQKSSRIQRKKGQKQEAREDISKKAALNFQNTMDKLLRIHHGRKNQIIDQKQIFTPFIPRVSEEYRTNGQGKLKDFAPSFNKRHTHHISGLNQLLKNIKLPEKSTSVGVSRTRIKLSIKIGSSNTSQKAQQNKSGQRVNRKKRKVDKQENQGADYARTVKKLERISQSTSIFNPDLLQTSFLDLIKKFKFENLKTLPKANAAVPHPNNSRTEPQPSPKSPNYFSPLTHYGEWIKPRNMNRANKTMMQDQWKQCRDEAKVNRKISMLSPWQLVVDGGTMGEADFIGPY